jgi:tRNA (guanine37-N1)-methyltransferase
MGRGYLRKALCRAFTRSELDALSNSYDVIGDIAVIRANPALKGKVKHVANAILTVNKSVRTVLNQTSPIDGEFRLRRLEVIAGEENTVTVYKEHGCVFKVDLTKAYFSPRLSYERKRVADLVVSGEVVVNMFAGVGCFSVIIAKHSNVNTVYSIDINPDAVRFMTENIALNGLEGQIVPIEGDAREVLEGKLTNVADRVLMPLPEKAADYLDVALRALTRQNGVIHYYDFVHAGKSENPCALAVARVKERMLSFDRTYRFDAVRVVRTTGPRWYQVVVDVVVLPT